MITAVYAGSFDPITLGHMDIIEKSSQIFDKVIVAVAKNPDKVGFIPVQDRVKIIKECVKTYNNVEVDTYFGLTTEFAKEKNAKILVRGLRNSLDFEYEYQLEKNNEILAPDIKTVFLTSNSKHNFISSTGVREIFSYNGDLSKLVPEPVKNYLLNADLV